MSGEYSRYPSEYSEDLSWRDETQHPYSETEGAPEDSDYPAILSEGVGDAGPYNTDTSSDFSTSADVIGMVRQSWHGQHSQVESYEVSDVSNIGIEPPHDAPPVAETRETSAPATFDEALVNEPDINVTGDDRKDVDAVLYEIITTKADAAARRNPDNVTLMVAARFASDGSRSQLLKPVDTEYYTPINMSVTGSSGFLSRLTPGQLAETLASAAAAADEDPRARAPYATLLTGVIRTLYQRSADPATGQQIMPSLSQIADGISLLNDARLDDDTPGAPRYGEVTTLDFDIAEAVTNSIPTPALQRAQAHAGPLEHFMKTVATAIGNGEPEDPDAPDISAQLNNLRPGSVALLHVSVQGTGARVNAERMLLSFALPHFLETTNNWGQPALLAMTDANLAAATASREINLACVDAARPIDRITTVTQIDRDTEHLIQSGAHAGLHVSQSQAAHRSLAIGKTSGTQVQGTSLSIAGNAGTGKHVGQSLNFEHQDPKGGGSSWSGDNTSGLSWTYSENTTVGDVEIITPGQQTAIGPRELFVVNRYGNPLGKYHIRERGRIGPFPPPQRPNLAQQRVLEKIRQIARTTQDDQLQQQALSGSSTQQPQLPGGAAPGGAREVPQAPAPPPAPAIAAKPLKTPGARAQELRLQHDYARRLNPQTPKDLRAWLQQEYRERSADGRTRLTWDEWAERNGRGVIW